MKHLKIYDGKKVITIKSVDDLCFLPDKSIKLVFDNSNYVTVLHLYIIYRVDVYLQEKGCSAKTRVKYFNMCINNLESFLEYEKEFLMNNATTFIIKPDSIPKGLKKIYRDSVIATCNFFRGILSTTSFLDKGLFPSIEDKKMVRHNYGNMISALLDSIED